MAASAYLIVAFAMLISCTHGALVHSSCPSPGSQDSFDLNQYLGKWYEYERFSAWFELGVVCGSAEYGLNDDGSVSVTNGGYRNVFGYKIPTSITGRATIPDPSRPSELRVSFSRFDRSTGGPNYFVVETDYTSYTIVFSCTDLPLGFSSQLAWILTRDRGVVPSNMAAIKSMLQSKGVDVTKFNSVDQSDCSGY